VDPRPGRHSSPDTGAGPSRSAAELLAAWKGERAGRGGAGVDVVAQPAGRSGVAAGGASRSAAAAAAAERRRRAQDGVAGDDRAAAPEPRTPETSAPDLRTAEMRAMPVMPPRISSTRPNTDRPTDGRPGARPTAGRPPADRPAGDRPGASRSPIARPAADRVSPAPWAQEVPSARSRERDRDRDRDREMERFTDDETAPGISSGSSRPLPGGRRTSDLGGATATATAAPAAPAWPAPSPLAAALAAIDARHAADDDADDTADDTADHEHDDRQHDTRRHPADRDWDDEHHPRVFDETGGLELVVADEDHSGDHYDDHYDDHDDDDSDGPDQHLGGGGGSRGRRGGRRGGAPTRRRRRPVAVVLSLLVLAGLVAGIFFGGQALLRMVNPAAEDFAGTGTGNVEIRINSGDSLRTIAATLTEADVIASPDPFLDAAQANPAATGIQPGVYQMRSEMSGQSALDLLLEPATRMVTRVTVPEGQTVAQVLERLAEQTGTPLADLQTVAAAPAELGLPPYANGMLEGFLFPATYDIEPDTTPAEMLRPMVARTVQVLDQLQVPVEQRLTVLAKASIVQAESRTVEQMGMVARVVENRLADGMPLQMDSTVNYASGKTGITTTPEDRANPSPYNTYANPGLPPGAIDNPGEAALRAVLNPTPGPWRYFVVVDPDTGDTRFAETAAEHQRNVLVFQQWLRENPGG
jgi:UPF0755 protein